MSNQTSTATERRIFENEQAWYGSTMQRRDDWIYELTNEDLSEIDKAIVGASKLHDLVSLRREHFPLKKLGERLSMMRRDLLHGRGFFLIRGFPVSRYTRKQVATAFLGLGCYLGEPVSQNGKGHILGHVKNLGLDFSDPETRGYQTAPQLAFHTDYSDVVGLLCMATSRAGGGRRQSSVRPLYGTKWLSADRIWRMS